MDPHRAQILKDMGIDLWRLRPAAERGAPAQSAQGASRRERTGGASAHRRARTNRAPAIAPGRQAADERHLQTAARTNRAPTAAPPRQEADKRRLQTAARTNRAPTDAPPRQEADERHLRTAARTNKALADASGRREAGAPEAATDAAFTLWAVCTPGILLVTGPFANRRMEVLAQDIARSAGGRWAEPTKLLRFAWPWPGATGSATPALRAFLDKQIQDFAVQRILATSSMAEKATASGLKSIAIPDLEQLESPEAKRELWRRLQAPAATKSVGSA